MMLFNLQTSVKILPNHSITGLGRRQHFTNSQIITFSIIGFANSKIPTAHVGYVSVHFDLSNRPKWTIFQYEAEYKSLVQYISSD